MQRRSRAESFVKLDARPTFGKGVRLRHEPDGTAMLLVPEGALLLNPSATAALDLIDGRRTVADIIACLVQRLKLAKMMHAPTSDRCSIVSSSAKRYGLMLALFGGALWTRHQAA